MPRIALAAMMAVLFGIASFSFVSPVAAQEANASGAKNVKVSKGKKAALEMLRLSGAGARMDAVLPLIGQQMINLLTKQHPDKADQIKEIFSEVLLEMSSQKGRALEMVAELYARHFTLAELNALSDFYRSPAGIKLNKLSPMLTRESFNIGRKWGAEIGRDIAQRFKEEAKKRGLDL